MAFLMFILSGEGRALDYNLPLAILFCRQDFGDVLMSLTSSSSFFFLMSLTSSSSSSSFFFLMSLTSELQKQFNYWMIWASQVMQW